MSGSLNIGPWTLLSFGNALELVEKEVSPMPNSVCLDILPWTAITSRYAKHKTNATCRNAPRALADEAHLPFSFSRTQPYGPFRFAEIMGSAIIPKKAKLRRLENAMTIVLVPARK